MIKNYYASSPLVAVELDTKEPRKVLYVSENIINIFGRQPDEILSDGTINSLFNSEDADNLIAKLKEFSFSGNTMQFLEFFRMKVFDAEHWVKVSAGLDEKKTCVLYLSPVSYDTEFNLEHSYITKAFSEAMSDWVDGIWVYDINSGKTTVTTGLSDKSEIKKVSYNEEQLSHILHPEDAERFFRARRYCLSKPVTMDEAFRLKITDKYRWYHIKARQYKDGGQTAGLRGTYSDVTDERHHEEIQNEYTSLFKNMFYKHSAPMYLNDPYKDEIIDVNNAALEFYGYSRGEFIGKKLTEIVDFDNDTIRMRQKQAMGTSNKPVYSRHMRKDGTVADVIVYLSPVEFSGRKLLLGLIHDITSQLTAEKKLRSSDEFLRKILNTVSSGISIYDLQGNILMANDMYARHYNLKGAEISGKNIAELVSDDEYAQGIIRDNQNIIDGNKAVTIQKDRYYCESAKKRYWFTTSKIPLDTDKPTGERRLLVISTDITETIEKQNRLERYMDIVNEQVIMSSTDTDGKITYASKAFCEISGYTEDELLGNNHNIVRSPDTPDSIFKEMWETITAGLIWKGELKNKAKNGEYYWVNCTIAPDYDETGRKTGYTSIRQDITNKKKLHEMSMKDALTGIYNRRYFNEIMPVELKRAKRDGVNTVFMMMDIDRFKQYNDTYGHQKGDETLMEIAHRVDETLRRASDFVFRLGGEEFGVLVRDIDEDKIHQLADKIRKAVLSLGIEHINNQCCNVVTVSVGVYSSFDSTMETMFTRADEALYRAKEEGRNRVVIWSEGGS